MHAPEAGAPAGRVATYRQHDAPDEVVAQTSDEEYKEYRQLTGGEAGQAAHNALGIDNEY